MKQTHFLSIMPILNEVKDLARDKATLTKIA